VKTETGKMKTEQGPVFPPQINLPLTLMEYKFAVKTGSKKPN